MADRYTRSTDGNDADGGTTWALAKATIVGVSAIDTVGDRLFVSQAHAETAATTKVFSGAGTLASPVMLLCANDGAEPPTALATGASVTCTGNVALTLSGCLYAYGLTFASAGTINLNGSAIHSAQAYEQCSFRITNTGSAGVLTLATLNNNNYETWLRACTLRFGGAANTVAVSGRNFIEGGSIVAGGTTPTSVFKLANDRSASSLLCSGFDFSNFASTFNLCDATGVASGVVTFRNCKLPASWTGVLVSGTIPGPGARYEMYNCDSADTNYRLWIEDYTGSIKSETTIKRTGGASDGVIGISWKMVSSANAEYPLLRLETGEIVVYNSAVGGSKTVTVEVVHDSQGAGSGANFQDDELWLEVMALNTSGFPLGTWVSDAKAGVLTAAANQTASSETWTTTGLTTPVKQALSVSFTPQEAGFIHARVVLAKASKTVYVCPKATVT